MTLPASRQQIIDEFRANAGQLGGRFETARVILLTTTDRTGATHTTPLTYIPDEGERLLVVASAAGADADPEWYVHLLDNPQVTVETGVFTIEASAERLDGDERDAVFARIAESDPAWADYQSRTSRVIPVVALIPTGGGPNAGPLGDGLRLVHVAFRRELAVLRAELAASGTGLGVQLRINCLTACEGLHYHHLVEDAHMFPALEASHPELADTVHRLGEEHGTVQRLLDELRARVETDGPEIDAVLADVDRLIAELNAHLDYEEEQLVGILNAMPPPG